MPTPLRQVMEFGYVQGRRAPEFVLKDALPGKAADGGMKTRPLLSAPQAARPCVHYWIATLRMVAHVWCWFHVSKTANDRRNRLR